MVEREGDKIYSHKKFLNTLGLKKRKFIYLCVE